MALYKGLDKVNPWIKVIQWHSARPTDLCMLQRRPIMCLRRGTYAVDFLIDDACICDTSQGPQLHEQITTLIPWVTDHDVFKGLHCFGP